MRRSCSERRHRWSAWNAAWRQRCRACRRLLGRAVRHRLRRVCVGVEESGAPRSHAHTATVAACHWRRSTTAAAMWRHGRAHHAYARARTNHGTVPRAATAGATAAADAATTSNEAPAVPSCDPNGRNAGARRRGGSQWRAGRRGGGRRCRLCIECDGRRLRCGRDVGIERAAVPLVLLGLHTGTDNRARARLGERATDGQTRARGGRISVCVMWVGTAHEARGESREKSARKRRV